jgi:type I restriction enzyme, R subunit
MWLTGFDAPAMHTMYVDKPMKAHGLMQAIARVNRTYKEKPAGLVVDYVGITDNLRRAVTNYSKRDQDKVGVDVEQGALVLQREYETIEAMLNGYDWRTGAHATDTGTRLTAVQDTAEWLLDNDDPDEQGAGWSSGSSTTRSRSRSRRRSPARTRWSVSSPPTSASCSRCGHTCSSSPRRPPTETAAHPPTSTRCSRRSRCRGAGVRVIDVFARPGSTSRTCRCSPRSSSRTSRRSRATRTAASSCSASCWTKRSAPSGADNVVQFEKYSDRLKRAIQAYRTRAITGAEALEHLVQLALEFKDDQQQAHESGMSADEWAFYEAVAHHGPALVQMGDDKLKALAAELVLKLREKVTIDWDRKQSVQAGIRATVKTLLAQRGYPPDYSDEAIELVLKQTEVFAEKWAAASGGSHIDHRSLHGGNGCDRVSVPHATAGPAQAGRGGAASEADTCLRRVRWRLAQDPRCHDTQESAEEANRGRHRSYHG